MDAGVTAVGRAILGSVSHGRCRIQRPFYQVFGMTNGGKIYVKDG